MYEHLFVQEIVAGRQNLIYSEVNAVKTGENISRFTVLDDRVEYAELNHNTNGQLVITNKEVNDTALMEEAAGMCILAT